MWRQRRGGGQAPVALDEELGHQEDAIALQRVRDSRSEMLGGHIRNSATLWALCGRPHKDQMTSFSRASGRSRKARQSHRSARWNSGGSRLTSLDVTTVNTSDSRSLSQP